MYMVIIKLIIEMKAEIILPTLNNQMEIIKV